jgi:hypothetical protein
LDPAQTDELEPDDDEERDGPVQLFPPDPPDVPSVESTPAGLPRIKSGKARRGKPIQRETAPASRTGISLPEFAQPVPEVPDQTGVPAGSGLPSLAPTPPDFLDTNEAPQPTALPLVERTAKRAIQVELKPTRTRGRVSTRAHRIKPSRSSHP